jgi:bla regulator protein blaR1
VWWIENRLSVEREMACDDAVLAETANPHGYATCLVSLLEKSLAHRLSDQSLTDKRWSMAQAAVNRAREASLRLAQILDKNRPAATRVWKPALGMIGAFFIVCLTVLPHTPEFVTVDHGMMSGNSNPANVAGLSQASMRPSLQNVAVIPAALRTGGSSSVEKTARAARVTTAKVVRVPARVAFGDRLASARSVAARMNEEPPRDQFVAISAQANQEIVPQFQTLVLIEATQYVTSDSSVWRVQVWRVTLVSTIGGRLAKMPVANSI